MQQKKEKISLTNTNEWKEKPKHPAEMIFPRNYKLEAFKQNFDIIVKVDEHGNDFKSIYLIYLVHLMKFWHIYVSNGNSSFSARHKIVGFKGKQNTN